MLFEKLEKINEIINKKYNLIGEEALNLKKKYDVLDVNEINQYIKELDKKGRDLKLGIVGRVKAGKSSLINSLLFNGEDILPKAETPMTAALTTIAYSDKYEIEIEFFTPKEIDLIKQYYKLYHKKFKEYMDDFKRKIIKKEIKEHEKKKGNQDKIQQLKSWLNKDIGFIPFFEDKKRKETAINYAKNKLKEDIVLQAAFEQYEMIQKNNLTGYSDKEKEIISYSSLKELTEKLKAYVGSNGKLMPITKIVHIKMPIEFLKEIEIIDTPGFNDPIVSREQRTRELLKICDVVFVLSPSTQFLTDNDIDLMLKITNDEGIKYINTIVTKIDDALFGNISEKSNHNLDLAINQLCNELNLYKQETINTLIKDYPYIRETFESLLKEDSLTYTSAIAISLLNKYDEEAKLIQNLKKHYLKNNASMDEIKKVLEKLGNLEALKKIINNVKIKKEKIIESKKEEFLKSQKRKTDKFVKELIKTIEKYKREIKNTSIEELETKLKKLEEKKDKFEYLDKNFRSLRDDFILKLEKELKVQFNNTNYLDLEKLTKKEKREKRVWYLLFIGKDSYEVDVLYLSHVKAKIREFLSNYIYDLNLKSKEIIKKDFIDELPKKLIKVIREIQVDINKDKAETIIDKILRENIIYPNFNLNCCISKLNEIPDNKVEGNDIVYYLGEIDTLYLKLEEELRNEILSYIDKLENKLDISLQDSFLEDYKKYMLKLKEDIKHKEETLQRLDVVLKELKDLR